MHESAGPAEPVAVYQDGVVVPRGQVELVASIALLSCRTRGGGAGFSGGYGLPNGVPLI